MHKLLRFYQSTLGKKVVVAVTGLALALFLVGHMAGNLKALAGFGPDGVHKLDHYAHFLRTFGSEMFGHGGFLWIARIGLLLALVLHVVTIIQLQIRNRAARPIDYRGQQYLASTLAARTMLVGGLVLLAFIIFHILHLTLGMIVPEEFQEGQVYANVYMAFSKPVFVFVYAVAMLVIGLHLYHGLWSVFQTLGFDSPERNKSLRMLARTAALGIALGFILVPLVVVSGKLPEPSYKVSGH